MPSTRMTTTKQARLKLFQRKLLAWYRRNKRDLPWRRSKDPYHILVSEIMLHQTQVDRVAPKYTAWLKKYPTVKQLAKAPLRQLKQEWKPLGYNYRPERLRTIARETVAKYNGKIPDTYDELIAMRGVGRYTAGAILSFAFRKDAPTLDTNVVRVLSRIFGLRGDLTKAPAQKKLWQLATDVIPTGKAYDFNQGMMDFGSAVCTARKPQCHSCSVHSACKAYPLV